ncbi:hypothetical protein [Neorhodopirellula pilleata]|uniref:Uncharacterized protein n=1 Tax=Neorhodopirellula pilleata TaxID=2714738 RepID=A0A5C6ANC8_9BACT|nr:hypothetical protein [Neorhodopirellula pilleata]TWU01553.1 hypothetical protein Pla100_12880 [Neorhodopirellula pilleata]
MRSRPSNLSVAVAIILLALVTWRAAWLFAGVPDSTAQADTARDLATRELGALNLATQEPAANAFRISFAELPLGFDEPFQLQQTGQMIWDPGAAIWITPGNDQQPGWATWDDNGNGKIDEPAELGAAWSDDFCVVEKDGQSQQPSGRIIDHGAYVPTSKNNGDPNAIRVKVLYSAIAK